jgi:hypothetical protein
MAEEDLIGVVDRVEAELIECLPKEEVLEVEIVEAVPCKDAVKD